MESIITGKECGDDSLDRKIKNKQRRESKIKKTEIETKDKLIKKAQPIAQSPPNATHAFRGSRNRLPSIHLLILVVSLSLLEKADERRGIVLHMHKDGVSTSRGQSVECGSISGE
jgi:hypothetical protein